MTTGESIAVLGMVGGLFVNAAALVWGAAKMSSRVEALSTAFKDFLTEHKLLERRVNGHTTAIALIAQAAKIPIRQTDLGEEQVDAGRD